MGISPFLAILLWNMMVIQWMEWGTLFSDHPISVRMIIHIMRQYEPEYKTRIYELMMWVSVSGSSLNNLGDDG